jgi:hypothetical protein
MLTLTSNRENNYPNVVVHLRKVTLRCMLMKRA